MRNFKVKVTVSKLEMIEPAVPLGNMKTNTASEVVKHRKNAANSHCSLKSDILPPRPTQYRSTTRSFEVPVEQCRRLAAAAAVVDEHDDDPDNAAVAPVN